jgi:hypothetical protein
MIAANVILVRHRLRSPDLPMIAAPAAAWDKLWISPA